MPTMAIPKSRFAALALPALLWVGCAAAPPAEPPFSAAVPAPPSVPVPVAAPADPASLWLPDAPLADLYGDTKARAVGDILTIRIAESAAASNRAGTNTSRSSGIEAGIANFLNLEQYYPATHVPRRFPFLNPFGKVNAGLEADFEGAGTTQRSGSLAASISVRVVETLPGGVLRVAGSREVRVNNERQFITLTGLVRTRDIGWDNTLLSTYLSDARIAYSGVGVIDDRQRPGWAGRVLDVIWPF
jgi:flagellar L-ring protein FlgH